MRWPRKGIVDLPKHHSEICGNCGCTLGSHNGTAYDSKVYGRHIPKDYCPGHEHRMDWDRGPGTVFEHTGEYRETAQGHKSG